MATIKLNVPGDPGSMRELMALLSIKGCDGNVIYELHDQRNPKKKEPDGEFVERSEPYYQAFISSYMVDQWASDNISYAAKIDGVWYFAINTGSNTYIGSGPMSTVRLRKFCFDNGIKILYQEQDFEEWYARTLGNGKIIPKEGQATGDRTVAQSYNEVNQIIYACGGGIARITDTASKMHEENYRDLFVATFYTHPQFTVENEPKIKDGYVDLKLFDTTVRVTFIYEFKIYTSKNDLEKAIFQVTKKYSLVHHRYNGIVFLNKRNVDLSDLINEIAVSLKNSSLILPEIEVLADEHKIIVRHRHTADSNINCLLTIFIFDIRKS
jgi:hypothetical protein